MAIEVYTMNIIQSKYIFCTHNIHIHLVLVHLFLHDNRLLVHGSNWYRVKSMKLLQACKMWFACIKIVATGCCWPLEPRLWWWWTNIITFSHLFVKFSSISNCWHASWNDISKLQNTRCKCCFCSSRNLRHSKDQTSGSLISVYGICLSWYSILHASSIYFIMISAFFMFSM